MKNILFKLMTSTVLLFTVGSGLEAQSTRMQAAVPFAWQVDGQHLNAGDYVIARDTVAHVIRISDKATGKGLFLTPIPVSENNAATRLVFHRYGDQYFLAEVVAPGVAGKLRVSPAEREAMQSLDRREMATIFIDIRPVLN